MPIFFNPIDGTLRVKPAKPKRFDPITGEFLMGWLPPQAGAAPITPSIPAEADLNYWLKVDGDTYLPPYMLDRSPNGIEDPLSEDPGQRGRMLYGDIGTSFVVPNAINGKAALQVSGQSRLNISTSKNANTFNSYFSVGAPFSCITAFRGLTLDSVNSFYILPEITGTPSLVNNFAMYAYFDGTNSYMILTNDVDGSIVLQGDITTTTFNAYSTVFLTYNGLGFSPANFDLRINGVTVPLTVSAFVIGSGNGGCFFGTNNDFTTAAAFLLESACWDKVLSAEEITALDEYMQSEYGLVVE